MSQSGRSNYTRLSLYTRLAKSILEGTHNADEVANLLVDVRFIEIPQAFADAIADARKRAAVETKLHQKLRHTSAFDVLDRPRRASNRSGRRNMATPQIDSGVSSAVIMAGVQAGQVIQHRPSLSTSLATA